MTSIYDQFVERRDSLLSPKQQSASELAKDLVELMEEIAIHGSLGIGGNPETKQLYVEELTKRIIASTEPDL